MGRSIDTASKRRKTCHDQTGCVLPGNRSQAGIVACRNRTRSRSVDVGEYPTYSAADGVDKRGSERVCSLGRYSLAARMRSQEDSIQGIGLREGAIVEHIRAVQSVFLAHPVVGTHGEKILGRNLCTNEFVLARLAFHWT